MCLFTDCDIVTGNRPTLRRASRAIVLGTPNPTASAFTALHTCTQWLANHTALTAVSTAAPSAYSTITVPPGP